MGLSSEYFPNCRVPIVTGTGQVTSVNTDDFWDFWLLERANYFHTGFWGERDFAEEMENQELLNEHDDIVLTKDELDIWEFLFNTVEPLSQDEWNELFPNE